MRLLVILNLLLLIMCGCERPTITNRILDHADSLLLENPEEALNTLNNIERTSLTRRPQKARFALLYSQALDKNYIDVNRDTLIRHAASYYKRHGSNDEKAQTFYYYGRIFENAQNIDSAIIQYAISEKFVQKTDNTYLKALIYYAMGKAYTQQRFFNTAQDKYIEAADYFENIGESYNSLLCLHEAVNASIVLKDYRTASDNLNRAYSLGKQLNDTTLLLANAKLRTTLITEGDLDNKAALRYLQNAYKLYGQDIFSSGNNLMLSELYAEIGQPDSAYYYLQPLLDNNSENKTREDAEIIFLASRILKAKGDYSRALDYSYKALTAIDSMYFLEKETSIPEIIEKYHNKELLIHNSYLEKVNLYQFIVAILVVILVGTFSMHLINRYRKHLKEHEHIIHEKNELLQKLQEEYDQLETIQKSNDFGEKNEYLRFMLSKRIAILKEMLEITATYGHDPAVHYNKLKKYIDDDAKQNNGIRSVYRNMMEIKYPGIFEFIQQELPKISETDIDYLCLSNMDLSTSAIAMMMGLQPKTVYNRRNQIRNKLNIQNDNIDVIKHIESLFLAYKDLNKE